MVQFVKFTGDRPWLTLVWRFTLSGYKVNDMASILNTKGYALLDPVQSSVPLYYIIVECMQLHLASMNAA
jgi:hypothetical protein